MSTQIQEWIAALEAEIAYLKAQDEIHWKTRRTLLKEKEALEKENAQLRGDMNIIARKIASCNERKSDVNAPDLLEMEDTLPC